MVTRTSVDGVELTVDFAAVARMQRAVKDFDRKLATNLRRNMRDAGKRLVGLVQDEVLSGSYQSDTGLRREVAGSIRLQIGTSEKRPGIRINSAASAMSAERRGMNAAWQSKRGFRHMVYGNPDTWAPQMGHPYFFRTVSNNRAIMDRAVIQANEQAAAELAREASS